MMKINMKLILASKSPRRIELLKKLGYTFEVIPAVGEEVIEHGLLPEAVARNIAEQKGKEVFAKHPDALVISADTIVVFDGEIIGKPKDDADAVRTLERLSGNVHRVVTGWCVLFPSGERRGYEVTEVRFNALSRQLIDGYVGGGLSADKAGSYGIQDGFPFVKSYSGSYFNIMGFPLEKINEVLKEVGYAQD